MSPFSREIAQIRSTYEGFAQNEEQLACWAPFAESERNVRAQQLLAFSRLMREAGFLDLAGLRILDLGCGSGRHLRHCVDMGASSRDLHGIELNSAALTLGRTLSPDLDIAQATGDTIDFPDATFDLVTH